MATSQKTNELGWMYFAPPKPKTDPPAPPVDYGLMSQIPGLNEIPPEAADEGQRGWIKESDSAYIRLAKQGGRQDLLQFRDPKPRSNEPKPYARCDWFYQEDNALHEQEAKGDDVKNDYEFLLPDYMVHDTYKGNENDNESQTDFKPQRCPYAADKQTVYEREGEGVTDKRIRIPEIKKPGFGVRADKMKDKPVRNVTIATPKSAKSSAGRKKNVEPTGEDRTTMARIIAGSYEQMWYDKLQEKLDLEHSHKPKGADGKHHMKPSKSEAGTRSEYQEVFSVATKDSRRPKYGRRAQSNDGGDGVNLKQEMAKIEKDVENMFKLSKFKNVPAKVDTNIGGHSVEVPS
ncbi:uncharacterized protein C7orf57 homolog [Tubulanus polymorphus]|uniref:uncharacterized protein C7orf57 homolog n=1 Tax=Tubulanus polymorphus TaxID=672921 RepID=UPI003DA5C060